MIMLFDNRSKLDGKISSDYSSHLQKLKTLQFTSYARINLIRLAQEKRYLLFCFKRTYLESCKLSETYTKCSCDIEQSSLKVDESVENRTLANQHENDASLFPIAHVA